MLSPSRDPGTTDKLIASGFTAMLSQQSPASFNDTITPLLASSSSSSGPTTAARWINVLFFISLVFSLAAALFGILAKQWLREYMQWNSSLALPRENVLVRQMWIEAWEAWNVRATIAAIPALLEIAMVEFLVGIVILLWTLDDIVAIVVTVTVVLFLGVFSTFTVLPIMSKGCPYKSPTAWACVVALMYMSYPIRLAYGWCCVLRARWKYDASEGSSFITRIRELFSSKWATYWKSNVKPPSVPFHVGGKSWRERDLETCNVTKIRRPGWWPRYKDVRTAAGQELVLEGRSFSASGTLLRDWNAIYWSSEDADILLRNISETALLVRALSWVDRASQDARVQAYISQSLPSIHRDIPKHNPECISGIRAVTLWCLISALRSNHFTDPHCVLRGADPERGPQVSTTITSLRKELGVTFDEAQGILFQYDIGFRFGLPGSPYVTILRRMLLTAVEPSMAQSGWADDKRTVRRACEWIRVWHADPYDFPPTDQDWNILSSILRSPDHARRPNLASGLCNMVLSIALDGAQVSVNKEKQLGKDFVFV
jgi:hypothetical protein